MTYHQFSSDCNCKYKVLDYSDGKFIKGVCISRVTCRQCGHVGLWIDSGYEHWSTTPLTQWPRYFWQRRTRWLRLSWYEYVFETESIRADEGLNISLILQRWRCRIAGHPYSVSVGASWNGLEPIYYCSHCYEEVG